MSLNCTEGNHDDVAQHIYVIARAGLCLLSSVEGDGAKRSLPYQVLNIRVRERLHRTARIHAVSRSRLCMATDTVFTTESYIFSHPRHLSCSHNACQQRLGCGCPITAPRMRAHVHASHL